MSYTVIYPQACVTRQLYKDVPSIAADNEFVWEPEGKEEVLYEVSIRLDAVEDMARKAQATRVRFPTLARCGCAF
jgi:hypothetical protein